MATGDDDVIRGLEASRRVGWAKFYEQQRRTESIAISEEVAVETADQLWQEQAELVAILRAGRCIDLGSVEKHLSYYSANGDARINAQRERWGQPVLRVLHGVNCRCPVPT